MTCNPNTNTSGSYSVPDNIIFTGDAQFPTSETYKQQSADFQRIYDALQDTDYMRARGTVYLPMEPAESQAAYAVRLNRSFYKTLFKDGTRSLLSRPFSQPVSVQGEDLDPRLQAIEDNADLLGNSLTGFAQDVFLTALRYGHCSILVDFPSTGPIQTLAEEKAIGARPNFVKVAPYDLVWVNTEVGADGSTLITEAHIKELRELDGERILHMRVYKTDTWELWAKGDGGWDLVDSGNHTFGTVPLLTMYTNRTGFLTSEPPLKSVAEMNVLHWQSFSDQRNILRHARVCLLFAKGFEEEETDFSVSVNNLIASSNDSSDLKYVEHSGNAIGAGQVDVEKIEETIANLLGMPTVEQAIDTTATGVFIKELKASSDLMAWSAALEILLARCYTVAGFWLGVELPDDFQLNVFTDWVTSGRLEDVPYLDSLYAKGLLSKQTLLAEYQRRSILPTSLDVSTELQKAEDEAVDNSGETV